MGNVWPLFINSLVPVVTEIVKIDWKYQLQQYGAALMAAVPVFVSLSLYIFYRRGYYDLYIANKVVAGDAAILLSIIFVLGPLSRFFNVFDRYLQYRKEIGIVAFFLALVHGLISSARYFSGFSWPLIFGLAALVILVFLFLISFGLVENALGNSRWWWLQNWGLRLAVLLTALHVFMMKFPGWVKWYQVGGETGLAHPELPGASLLLGWLVVFAFLIRLAEFGGVRFGRIVWYFSVITLPIIFAVTFWWGFRVEKIKSTACFTRERIDRAPEEKRCLVIFDNKVYDMTSAAKWDLTGHVGRHLCGKEYDQETIEKGPHKIAVMEPFLIGKLCESNP